MKKKNTVEEPSAARKEDPSPKIHAILKALGALLLFTGVKLAVSAVFSLAVFSGETDSSAVLLKLNKITTLISLISCVIIAAAVYLIIRFRGGKPEVSLRIRKINPKSLILCLVFGISFNFAVTAFLAMIPMPESLVSSYNDLYDYLGSGNIVLEVIDVALVTPIVEEIIFRGIFHGQLESVFSFIPAALISSAVFGAMHGNVISFVFTFVLGFVLALAFNKCKTLIAPIAIHLAFNGSSYIVTELMNGADEGMFAAVAAISSVLCVLSALFLIKQPAENKR